LREQSENVYENKGRGQKVEESTASTAKWRKASADSTAKPQPRTQRLISRLFGCSTSCLVTPEVGEQSENVYENKE
jgi:hypothetical protein